MRNLKNIFYSFFIGFIFFSCAPAYTPNMVNTPLLTNEGEFQAAIGTGTSGIDGQLSYGVTEQVGVMLNGSFANRTDTGSENYHKHTFIEMGAGYSIPIGGPGRFEIYGGGGIGSVDARFGYNSLFNTYVEDRSSADFTRLFLQPTIGVTNNVFDGSFTPRLVLLNINNSNSLYSNYSWDPYIEPTFTAKVGWKYVKMVFQLGFSVPLVELKNYRNQPFMFSIGMIGKIPGKKNSETVN